MILSIERTKSARLLAGLHAASVDDAWSAADIETLLASPGVFALLARAREEAAGFVLVRAIIDEAEILTLAVNPAVRRQGFGRALIEAAAGSAEGAGSCALFLEVAENNGPALALYDSCGFEQVGRRAGYYVRGAQRLDALILRRALNSAEAGHYVRPG